MAFYELRQYKVRPGKMAEWLKIMEEELTQMKRMSTPPAPK